MLSESEVINILNTNQFCIFFGSGISKQVGLPDGIEFGKNILMALGASKDEAEYFLNNYHLERMLYLLNSFLRYNIHKVYLALNTSNYGNNHSALAKLNLEKFIPLLTTNQDELVEIASDNRISYKNFVKIHGTLSDENSLRVTLDRVSKLSVSSYNFISELTKNRKILVIGYSFSDYDLKYFFQTRMEDIYYCAFNQSDIERYKILLGDKSNQLFDSNCVDVKTNSFLSDLAYSVGLTIPSYSSIDVSKVKELIKNKLIEWGNQYTELLKRMALSSLGKGLWKAEITFKIMNEIADNKNTPAFYRIVSYSEASNAAEALNKYNQQLSCLKKLKKINGVNKILKSFFLSLFKANYHHIQDNCVNWLIALFYYKKAYKLYIKLKMVYLEQEHKNLIFNYFKSINHGIASTLEKLNRVYSTQNKLNKSMNLVNQYIDNENLSCDLDFLCEMLFIRAKIFIQKKEFNSAEKDYKDALEISVWIKKSHSVMQALRGIGRLMGIKQNFKMSLEYIERANNIKTDEPILSARNKLTLSWLYKQMSKKSKEDGITIYQKYRGKLRGYLDASLYLKRGK